MYNKSTGLQKDPQGPWTLKQGREEGQSKGYGGINSQSGLWLVAVFHTEHPKIRSTLGFAEPGLLLVNLSSRISFWALLLRQ